MWPVDDVWVLFALLSTCAQNCRVVLTRLIGDRLHLSIILAGYGLRLVDSAAIAQDPLLLGHIVGLVIDRQVAAVVAAIVRHDGARVSHVHDEDTLLHEQGYDCARA